MYHDICDNVQTIYCKFYDKYLVFEQSFGIVNLFYKLEINNEVYNRD